MSLIVNAHATVSCNYYSINWLFWMSNEDKKYTAIFRD